MDRLRLCVHACARLLALNEFFPQIIQETSKSSLQKTLHASGQSLVKVSLTFSPSPPPGFSSRLTGSPLDIYWAHREGLC